MPMLESPRKYAHIPTLQSINKQLLARDKSLNRRFQCIGFTDDLKIRCDTSSHTFPIKRPLLMKRASRELEKAEVSDEAFVIIARSLFCGSDDALGKFESFEGHLRGLWRRADEETQCDFLKAIKQGHQDIFKYYSELQGCTVEAIELAIEVEALREGALPAKRGSDQNENRIVLYDSKANSLLQSILEVSFHNLVICRFIELIKIDW